MLDNSSLAAAVASGGLPEARRESPAQCAGQPSSSSTSSAPDAVAAHTNGGTVGDVDEPARLSADVEHGVVFGAAPRWPSAPRASVTSSLRPCAPPAHGVARGSTLTAPRRHSRRRRRMPRDATAGATGAAGAAEAASGSDSGVAAVAAMEAAAVWRLGATCSAASHHSTIMHTTPVDDVEVRRRRRSGSRDHMG